MARRLEPRPPKAVLMPAHSRREERGDSRVRKATSYSEALGTQTRWNVDSGATDHMVTSLEVLSDVQSLKETVTIADKTKIASTGVGTVRCLGTNGTEVDVKDVWHVPKLHRNLLSVGAIDRSGGEVIFGKGRVQVKDKSGRIVLVGSLSQNGLYELNVSSRQEQQSHLVETDVNLWHRCLGHAHFDSLKNSGVPVTGTINFCGDCQLGKSSRNPYVKKKQVKPVALFETLHMDLCGPMQNPGLEGEKYFLAVTDESSDLTLVETFPFKESEAIVSSIKDSIAYLERQSGALVKNVKCDGGSEFINSNFASYCQERGIEIRQSNAHSPEQNGRAERKNRTLVETARTMIQAGRLNSSLWSEAIKTATYLRNRIANRQDGKSPWERFFGEAPSIKHIRTFGSRALNHIPAANRKKWDAKAQEGILIGYLNNRYKLLVSGRIVWSREQWSR